MRWIGNSYKRIYTIPEGQYDATWHEYVCTIYSSDNKELAQIQTTTRSKKKIDCVVIILGSKCKIFDKTKPSFYGTQSKSNN